MIENHFEITVSKNGMFYFNINRIEAFYREEADEILADIQSRFPDCKCTLSYVSCESRILN